MNRIFSRKAPSPRPVVRWKWTFNAFSSKFRHHNQMVSGRRWGLYIVVRWSYKMHVQLDRKSILLKHRYEMDILRAFGDDKLWSDTELKIPASIVANAFCGLHNDKYTKYSPHKNCLISCLHLSSRENIYLTYQYKFFNSTTSSPIYLPTSLPHSSCTIESEYCTVRK